MQHISVRIMKIESCKAEFSACGGSQSDKFLFTAVRSMRSAFLLDRKCDAISYQAKNRITKLVIRSIVQMAGLEPARA